jgi:hypothetical protein
MLRVPPLARADGADAPGSPDPLAAAAEARRSRLADAAWMLESEAALQEGLGRAMAETAGDGSPIAARFDEVAGGLIGQIIDNAPEDVSDSTRAFAKTRADEALGAVAGAWRAHDEAGASDRALSALRRNLTGLFRDGRHAGAGADEMTAAALGRIELLRGAMPDAALAGIAGWSRGMAAAAHLDGALARGDAEDAEAALADPHSAAVLPDAVRDEFARRAGIVRRRMTETELRRDLQGKVAALAGERASEAALERAVEAAAGSTRIRDEQERAAFGWSLRADLARARTIAETRRLAVERHFRAELADPAAEAEDLFALLDRAETEGLLDDDRIARLRRDMTVAFERRAGIWVAAFDGARHLADPAVFDRKDRTHRAAIDAWWRVAVDGEARDRLDPDAAEAGLFADIRPEAENAIPGADAGPNEIARDIAARTGYLPTPVAHWLFAAWQAGGEAEIAAAADLAAAIATANAGALGELDRETVAGLLATAVYLQGGATPEQAVAAARGEDLVGNGTALPASLPRLLAGGDATAEAAIADLLSGQIVQGVPTEDGGAGGPAPEPEGIARVEDRDGRTIVRDPETGEVIGETDFRAADAIAEILSEIGLGKDFGSLTEDEKQALIDAAAMIPGIGEGISALQAYEAALAAARAWEAGDYGEAALQGLLAGLDAAGAIPGIGKAFKAVKIFGGFLGRAARKGAGKLAEQAGKMSGEFDNEFGDYAMSMAGNGPGSRIPGPRPDGSWNDQVPFDNGSKLPGETGGVREKVPGAVKNRHAMTQGVLQEKRAEAALHKQTDVNHANRGMHEQHDAEEAKKFDAIFDANYPEGIPEGELRRVVEMGYDSSQKRFIADEVAIAIRMEKTQNRKLRRAPKGSGADFIDERTGEKIDVVGGPSRAKELSTKNLQDSVRSHYRRALDGITIVFDVRGWSPAQKKKLGRIINSESDAHLRKNPKDKNKISEMKFEMLED